MKKYTRISEKEKLYEMSNLFPQDTGLDFTMWITTKSGREKHNARIKLNNSDGEIIISIFGKPEIKGKKGKIIVSGKQMKKIVKFIELNRDVLLKHWSGETSSKQFGKDIISI